MSAGRICSRVVATAGATETVIAAACRMAEHNLGTLVVIESGGRPLGLITDRDIAIRCVAAGFDATTTTVGDVMTDSPRSVDESTPIDQALAMMAGAGTRRTIVTGPGGAVVGILSVDDLIQLLAEEMGRIDSIIEREAPVFGAAAP
jgi:CBS domain-containing protein